MPAAGDAGQTGKHERLQADVRDAPVVAAGVGADPEQDDRPDGSDPGGTMAGGGGLGFGRPKARPYQAEEMLPRQAARREAKPGPPS